MQLSHTEADNPTLFSLLAGHLLLFKTVIGFVMKYSYRYVILIRIPLKYCSNPGAHQTERPYKDLFV